jgi:hypothetical protein
VLYTFLKETVLGWTRSFATYLVQEIPGKADIMPSLLISLIILILLQFNYLRRKNIIKASSQPLRAACLRARTQQKEKKQQKSIL